MKRNPEFQRQLWLNWRPSLLAWSLGLSLLVLLLPLALPAAKSRAGMVATVAMAGLWAAALLYGSVLAGRSLAEEARQNTWDWQRLSALTPWQLAWGKLLGATIPAWLYTLWFAIAGMVLAVRWVNEPLLGLHSIALAVLWGLALQSWAMNLVLLSWGHRDQPVNRRRAALLPVVLLLLVPGPALGPLYDNLFGSSQHGGLWWGFSVGRIGMAYLFGAMVLGLGLLALWRQLCSRLDVRTLPWAWPLGLAVTGLFVAGTFNADFSIWLSYTASLALLGTIYIGLQHMDQHLRAWRQVQWSASRGRWREALEALPLWPISLLLASVASVLLLIVPGGYEPELGLALGSTQLFFCLHLLRDCLLLTGFALLAGKLKSPLAALVIAWLIINLAAPLLAYGVAGMKGAAAVQPVVAMLFANADAAPEIGWFAGMAWVSLGLQIALALGWVVHVFRERVLGFARIRDGAASGLPG